ncbi:MAG: alkaline phosphatase family protein, partial [Oligoflexia bacterium]|nr:alkaline phosphatase family protein [Oligoflexia bacterium]
FKWLSQSRQRGFVSRGVSTTPTISVRNLPLIKTGAPVAGSHSTGIPNFHFVDRQKQRAYYFYGNDALSLESLAEESGLITFHQRFAELNSLNCSAQYDRGTKHSFNAFLNLAVGEKVRDFGERLCTAELQKRVDSEKNLRRIRNKILDFRSYLESKNPLFNRLARFRIKQLIEELSTAEDEGLPQIMTLYAPWPDHFAHFKGPFSDEILSPTGELNRLDYWLGMITSLYRDAGVFDRSLFGIAGDHGLTPVFYLLNPEIEVFENFKSRGIDLRVEKISSDEGEGPKMTHPLRPPSIKNIDVVIASTAGGNYMMDFFTDQDSNWASQPTYRDLVKWRSLKGAVINIPNEIVRILGNSLEYLAVREVPTQSESSGVRLMRFENGQLKTAIIWRKGDRLFYEGDDVVDLGRFTGLEGIDHSTFQQLYKRCVRQATKQNPSSWCNATQWRSLTAGTWKPDSVVQLAHLYDHDRAGTINLFPKRGYGYNSKVPGRHAGEDFHEKDAMVAFWGGPVKAQFPIPTAVNGSMPVTLYEYLSQEKPFQDENGWGFPSLLYELQTP